MCYNINMTETIKTKMQEKGLTQKQMAELVGVSQAYISYIVNRQRTPSLRIALKIARVLDCPVDILFDSLHSENISTKRRNVKEEKSKNLHRRFKGWIFTIISKLR